MPQVAEMGPRIIAFLIDFLVIPVLGYVAILVLAAVLGAVSDVLGALLSLVGSVGITAFFFWQIYQEGTTGQTVGKKYQHIMLVGLENGGQPIGFGMAFLRTFLNNLVCYLGWLFAFFDPQRQTLGDKVSKSVVVPARS
jgi:uncharacterized RDD family membrane protein YckC